MLCYNPVPHGTGHINVLAVYLVQKIKFSLKCACMQECRKMTCIMLKQWERQNCTIPLCHYLKLPENNSPKCIANSTVPAVQSNTGWKKERKNKNKNSELVVDYHDCLLLTAYIKQGTLVHLLCGKFTQQVQRHFLCALFCYYRNCTHWDLYLSRASCWSQRHQLLSNYRYCKKMSSL